MPQSINKNILLTVLILGCFLSTLNQTLLNVALSKFMDIFSVEATTVQWLTTGFMLVNGILIPITAYLMKRFTTRQLFISSMLFLLIGSVLCAAAPNFGILLTGRMVQAVGAGIIMPLMMSVVMFIFPLEKRGSAMGLIGLAIIFAPAIAPTLAGFIIDFVSWRWLFIGMIPFVIIIILLAGKYLVNVTETEKAKLDVTSVILSTFGFGFVLYGVSTAGRDGWGDIFVISTTVAGLILTSAFCLRQIKSADPLLNLTVFNNKTFLMTSIINILVMMMMYADMTLLPIYLQDGRNFTAFDAGLLLLPGALVNAFLSPVTGKIYDRIGAKPLFIVGLLFIVPSMYVITDLSAETTYQFLLIRTIFLRIGLSCITMPLNTAGLNALPQQLIIHGTAVNNTLRQLSGSIGTAIVITVFSMQTTQRAGELSTAMPEASSSSILQMATAYGTGNAYYFMMVLAIAALILSFFFSGKNKVEAAADNSVEESNLQRER